MTGYRPGRVRCSASMRFVRISLMRVRWPWPLDRSQSTTCASSRTLTATLRGRASRRRTIPANCSSVRRGMSSRLMRESSTAAWRVAIRRRVWRSRSVHFLLLISSDLMFFSRAGRDDADGFFAMTVLPVRMDNEQHDTGSRFNPSCTQRMPALFLCIPIDAVRIDQATFVIEGQRGYLKGDSVMFSLVPPILLLTPFVTHRVYT